MFEDGLCEAWTRPDTSASRSLIDDICLASRMENQSAARRLAWIGELFEMRRAERGEEEHWAVDTWAAVAAEIAAALRISLGKAGSFIATAQAMRRMPRVAALFSAGDIDMAAFHTIAYRTDLITDRVAMAAVDRRIAVWAARCPSLSRGRLVRNVDAIVTAHDPDATRRNESRSRDRGISIWNHGDGVADISGRLLSTDAHLLDKRLDDLAAGVCEADPRTRENRRADALGVLAAGGDRLMCRCGDADCPSAAATRSPVVIHVVAEQAALQGNSDRPGYVMGADSLISAEALRDLAAHATLRPLSQPAETSPEPGYRPSRRLADFVRARDLTCRAPGCDRPATDCDLDHTIPWSEGGATHRSNIKALCRFHHLVKTFWGWKDKQLADGTVIWTLPDGQVHVTTPGSALLFPTLSTPTGTAPEPTARRESRDGRSAMMPLRKTTRAASRAHRISTERAHNHQIRTGRASSADPNPDADGPPF